MSEVFQLYDRHNQTKCLTVRMLNHQATRPPGHQATRPPGCQATRQPGHQATRPPGNQATSHSKCVFYDTCSQGAHAGEYQGLIDCTGVIAWKWRLRGWKSHHSQCFQFNPLVHQNSFHAHSSQYHASLLHNDCIKVDGRIVGCAHMNCMMSRKCITAKNVWQPSLLLVLPSVMVLIS